MVNRMGVIKTTIVIDEEAWKEFKRSVSSIYGSLRMTSFAVEEAIKCFNAVDLLKDFSNAMALNASGYPSVREVEERRPKLRTSAGEELRRMRDERQTRLSRLKQHREKIH
jgi:hypothetical protein